MGRAGRRGKANAMARRTRARRGGKRGHASAGAGRNSGSSPRQSARTPAVRRSRRGTAKLSSFPTQASTEHSSGPTSRQCRASVRFGTCSSVTGQLQQFKFRATAGRVWGAQRVPKIVLNSVPWGPQKIFNNGRMDDARLSPPTRPPLAKRLGNSEKLAASGGGRAVALPACLTVVKHKGNASHVGITCPNWGALEGPAPAAHAKGFYCPGFQAQKRLGPAMRASPGCHRRYALKHQAVVPWELLGPRLGPLAPTARAKGLPKGSSAAGCTRHCSGHRATGCMRRRG
jgi:hypothetical protein